MGPEHGPEETLEIAHVVFCTDCLGFRVCNDLRVQRP